MKAHDPPTHKISLGEIGVGHAETCVRLGKNDPALPLAETTLLRKRRRLSSGGSSNSTS